MTQRIRQINQTSPIHTTSFGDIEISKILDLHAFDVDAKLTTSETSFHDDRISTVTITFPFWKMKKGFQSGNFLQHVLWDNLVNGKM